MAWQLPIVDRRIDKHHVYDITLIGRQRERPSQEKPRDDE